MPPAMPRLGRPPPLGVLGRASPAAVAAVPGTVMDMPSLSAPQAEWVRAGWALATSVSASADATSGTRNDRTPHRLMLMVPRSLALVQRWLFSSIALVGIRLPPRLGDRPSLLGDGWDWDDDYEDEGDPFVLLLTLLVLFGTLFVILLAFSITIALFRRSESCRLSDDDLLVDVQHEDETEDELSREAAYIDGLRVNHQAAVVEGYLRAKAWTTQHPLGSVSTDITLSQSLAIQEKGVAAWAFEPNYEDNPSVLVSTRTELSFLPDGVGMALEEGGAACVQSSLPVPRFNSVYYFEVKMFDLPPHTKVAVGLAPKPYPHFRFPGLQRLSVGYFSDGTRCHNHPWNQVSYGPAYSQGDVIGVGFHPRGGHVFFTRNGRRLRDAFCGLTCSEFFPTVAANGPAEIHVNFGQAGFLFIEANVRRLGFAPMIGTLPPPPPYGAVRGSILIETGDGPVPNRVDGQGVASSSRAASSGGVWNGFAGRRFDSSAQLEDEGLSPPAFSVSHLAPPQVVPRIRRIPPPAPLHLDLSSSPDSPPRPGTPPAQGPPVSTSSVAVPHRTLSREDESALRRTSSGPPPYTSRPSSPYASRPTSPHTSRPTSPCSNIYPSPRNTLTASTRAHYADPPSSPAPEPQAEVSPHPSSEQATSSTNSGTGPFWKSYLTRLLPSKPAPTPSGDAASSEGTADSADETELDDEDDALLAVVEPTPTMVTRRRGRSSHSSRPQSRSRSRDNVDIEAEGANE